MIKRHFQVMFFSTLLCYARVFSHDFHEVEAMIASSIYEDYGSCFFYNFLIEGLSRPHHDFKNTENFDIAYSGYLKMISSNPKVQKKMSRAQEYIAKEVNKGMLETIIQNRVYFRVVHSGNSMEVNLERPESELQFIIRDWKGKEVSGSYALVGPIRAHLNDLFPGLALGMVGMKMGEKRELLVHPEYGYGLFNDFADGMPFWIQVEVIDCFESKKKLELSDYPVDLLSNLQNESDFYFGDFEIQKIEYWKSKEIN